MKYKNKKDAIQKIARELGIIKGTLSLPKIFHELEESEDPYRITKHTHIINLLSHTKTKKYMYPVLQKIFSVHQFLPKTVREEIEPALNKLGFTQNDGALMMLDEKKDRNLKTNSLRINQKYSKNSSLISNSIARKGEKLSNAYFAIYLIENHLRLFVWKLAGKSNRKLSKLLNEKDKKKIAERKNLEKQNKWLPLRKDSNLFYLDIEDLGVFIQRNWIIFKKYFSDEHWIKIKIEEVGQIRNRVAHCNSFVSPIETKTLELYMEQIFKQIQ